MLLVSSRALAQDPAMAPSFVVGDAVDVLYGSTWYPATVLAVPQAAQWQIAYDGYGAEWYQVVGPERIRARTQRPAAVPPGRAAAHLSRIGPGTNVLVEWRGHWYRARIVRPLSDSATRIRYVGYGREWDEDVGAARVRLPVKG